MSQKMYFIPIHFFEQCDIKNGSLTFLRPTKSISSVPCKKCNFEVLVFKSRRSLWGHTWCHKNYILLTFKGICMKFLLIKSSRYLWDTLYATPIAVMGSVTVVKTVRKRMFLYKWPLYDHSWPFFCHMNVYLSQNWGSDGHFEMLNGSKSWLVQKLWPQM